jgi:hypothetical protein
MTSYITNLIYTNSENTLYCDDVQLFKRDKEVVVKIDYSSNSQLRKNTNRIQLNFDELLDNIDNIKEVSCEGVSKKLIRYFKSIANDPKKLKKFCLIVVGEEETKFECSFSLSGDLFTITKK